MSDFYEKVKDIYEDDLLDRPAFAEALYNLISKRKPILIEEYEEDSDGERKTPSLVIALDSSWGSGKTHFLNYFEKTLRKLNKTDETNFYVVRYNAWLNDDFDEPLLSILHSIIKEQQHHEDRSQELIQKGVTLFKETVLPIALDIIKNKTGFDAHRAYDIMQKTNRTEKFYTFEKYEEALGKKKKLKMAMEKFSEDKKVVVLIDELDRCRPTYAIELLETIKHYLNVKNYVFVFALDKDQLSHSIKTLYGTGMDSSGYLRRFFDYVLNFPVPCMKNFCTYSLSAIDMEPKKKQELIYDIEKLANALELSCRDMKIILNNFIILWETILDSETVNHYIMEAYIFIISLKYKFPKEYKGMLDGTSFYRQKDEEREKFYKNIRGINTELDKLINIIKSSKILAMSEKAGISQRDFVVGVDDNYCVNSAKYSFERKQKLKYEKELFAYFIDNKNLRFPEFGEIILPVSNLAKLLLIE
ncbi:MAG: hypothetical protein JXN65_03135, partial [Clostridia bacterium]|nr:hypothetical protein [Clostridia bacterium]